MLNNDAMGRTVNVRVFQVAKQYTCQKLVTGTGTEYKWVEAWGPGPNRQGAYRLFINLKTIKIEF